MVRKLWGNFRNQWMGALALFLVLTGGSAYALSGSNTVFTDDIADDTVPASGGNPAGGLVAADLRSNSVRSAEVANNTLGTADFAKSIPAAHVTNSVGQSIPATATPLAFDTERYDTAGMHNNATNNSRLTAPVSGIYVVTAEVTWGNVITTGEDALFLRKNGTTEIAFDRRPAGSQVYQEVTAQVRLAAGDYVEAVGEPDDGGGVSKLNETSPEFSMTWLAPGP